MNQIVSTESLQYVIALINTVKDSPLGICALLCLVVGFIFYLISAFKGFEIYSFVSYALTLVFFGIVIFAVYTPAARSRRSITRARAAACSTWAG